MPTGATSMTSTTIFHSRKGQHTMANGHNGLVGERKKDAPKAAPTARKAAKPKPKVETENTVEKQSKPDKHWQLKPGQSGNPAGRPKGLRNTVSRDFLSDILTVWNEANEKGNKTGLDCLRELAATRPGQFVSAVGNLIPREFALDDETQEGFMGIWQALAKASASKDDE